jgi:hypothetical protein
MIETFRKRNILFQHDQVSFVCPSDKNIFKNEEKYAAFVELPYFSIDNAHPKLFRHSFWCIDNAHDSN